MIIGNLVGGLGNQMFQYACARVLALELRLPLKVTLDMFGVYAFHNGPELERVFSLDLDVATRSDLRHMIGVLRVYPLVRKLLAGKALSIFKGRNFVVEPYYRYWDGLAARLRDGGYLQGYWQSECYFAKYAATLRNDFAFRHAPSGRNAELQHEIPSGNSVSIHVRRGDYVSNAKTLAVHGTCSLQYYFNAIALLQRHIPDLRLFAFSDDPEWVAAVLKPRYPGLVLVDHNRGEDSYNDMRLMSLCRHHIIANSSFSWWGAWLNPDPAKMVVAPRNWFANNTDTTDLIPGGWWRI